MARPKKSTTLDEKISRTELKVQGLKQQYEKTLAELQKLYDERDKVRAEVLLKAMAQRGKSFEEVLRLIEL
jgi:Tfp pilus assembly protein PilF